MKEDINTIAKRTPVVHHQYHNKEHKKESELGQYYREVLQNADTKSDVLFFMKGIMDKESVAVDYNYLRKAVYAQLHNLKQNHTAVELAEKAYTSSYTVRNMLKDDDYEVPDNLLLVMGYGLLEDFREKFKP